MSLSEVTHVLRIHYLPYLCCTTCRAHNYILLYPHLPPPHPRNNLCFRHVDMIFIYACRPVLCIYRRELTLTREDIEMSCRLTLECLYVDNRHHSCHTAILSKRWCMVHSCHEHIPKPHTNCIEFNSICYEWIRISVYNSIVLQN